MQFYELLKEIKVLQNSQRCDGIKTDQKQEEDVVVVVASSNCFYDGSFCQNLKKFQARHLFHVGIFYAILDEYTHHATYSVFSNKLDHFVDLVHRSTELSRPLLLDVNNDDGVKRETFREVKEQFYFEILSIIQSFKYQYIYQTSNFALHCSYFFTFNFRFDTAFKIDVVIELRVVKKVGKMGKIGLNRLLIAVFIDTPTTLLILRGVNNVLYLALFFTVFIILCFFCKVHLMLYVEQKIYSDIYSWYLLSKVNLSHELKATSRRVLSIGIISFQFCNPVLVLVLVYMVYKIHSILAMYTAHSTYSTGTVSKKSEGDEADEMDKKDKSKHLHRYLVNLDVNWTSYGYDPKKNDFH
jgi:hypothetical protein